MVQGEVHANFGPDPSSSLGGEWRQTNKQTDRQTDTPFCFIYIDCTNCELAFWLTSSNPLRLIQRPKNIPTKFNSFFHLLQVDCKSTMSSSCATLPPPMIHSDSSPHLPPPSFRDFDPYFVSGSGQNFFLGRRRGIGASQEQREEDSMMGSFEPRSM